MRKVLIRLLLACMTVACSMTVVHAELSVDEYELGAGDMIHIHVFGEPDLEMETRLSSSGDIRYPFLGKVHVAGKKLSELEHLLTKGLADGYLIDPQVRVSIEEFRPFFVNGEVENPGAYPYKPGLTYRKAIAMGGGMKERADDDKIYVIHEGQGEQMQHVDHMDAEIQPGDVIVIKQGLF